MTHRGTLRQSIERGLASFEKSVQPLPGIGDLASRRCFIEQFVDSVRRVEYVRAIASRTMDAEVANPHGERFDVVKAAVYNIQKANYEEAFWLVFLFVHFGKPLRGGWRLVREVYSGPSSRTLWTWQRVSRDVVAMTAWLDERAALWDKLPAGERPRFGNHRKYESLANAGKVIESYVSWVLAAGSHYKLVEHAMSNVPIPGFAVLYASMDSVTRFGRTAKFDYLTMLGKLGLAPIEPDVAYLQGATGPTVGASLLLTGERSRTLRLRDLEQRLVQLGGYLGVGQQVIEDGLCNWQKSPSSYRLFRG